MLDLSWCELAQSFEKIWEKPSLQYVNLFDSSIAGAPPEVFADKDNHLPVILAHFRDLAAGASSLTTSS
jgi:hypothetical protein